jgi:hypothetical protein
MEEPPIHIVNQRLGLVAGERNQLKLRTLENLSSQVRTAARSGEKLDVLLCAAA